MLQDKNLRLEEVKLITSLSASTIWRLEKEGTFPKRHQISKRAVAWKASAIQEWFENQLNQVEV